MKRCYKIERYRKVHNEMSFWKHWELREKNSFSSFFTIFSLAASIWVVNRQDIGAAMKMKYSF